jgi:hypothetical protein|tara:strand:+ start:1602 stop:1844 length:243 start_codon:yes stop_codon:yes gene_type:complete
MKRILAPILLVVLLFPTLALGEEVTMDDLVLRKKDGLYFKKFTDVPFDGEVTGTVSHGACTVVRAKLRLSATASGRRRRF